MRIKKVSQTTPVQAHLTNAYSESTQDGYSADYINGLHEYSTTEQRVGTWIDGKPLYRKVYQTVLPTPSTDRTNATNSINLDINNLGEIFIEFARLYVTAEGLGLIYSLNYASSDKTYFYATNINKKNNTLNINNNRVSFGGSNTIVSVLYTKTTD